MQADSHDSAVGSAFGSSGANGFLRRMNDQYPRRRLDTEAALAAHRDPAKALCIRRGVEVARVNPALFTFMEFDAIRWECPE
jgi:hypothetical protein